MMGHPVFSPSFQPIDLAWPIFLTWTEAAMSRMALK